MTSAEASPRRRTDSRSRKRPRLVTSLLLLVLASCSPTMPTGTASLARTEPLGPLDAATITPTTATVQQTATRTAPSTSEGCARAMTHTPSPRSATARQPPPGSWATSIRERPTSTSGPTCRSKGSSPSSAGLSSGPALPPGEASAPRRCSPLSGQIQRNARPARRLWPASSGSIGRAWLSSCSGRTTVGDCLSSKSRCGRSSTT